LKIQKKSLSSTLCQNLRLGDGHRLGSEQQQQARGGNCRVVERFFECWCSSRKLKIVIAESIVCGEADALVAMLHL
jgi:hypothetical protein